MTEEAAKEKADAEAEAVYHDEDFDRGRAWLVALAAAVAMGISEGTIYSIGIYNVEFLEAFGETKFVTALLSGVPTALAGMAGPLASIMNNTFSIRTSVMVGGILMNIGFLCSVFIREIWVLMIFFGIITGFGMALTVSPPLVITGFYFEKKLNIANAIIGVGVSVGTVVFPFILRAIIDLYGWRGSLMIMSGISLNLCVCGLLMRPNKQSKMHRGKVCEIGLFRNWKLVLLFVNAFIVSVGLSVTYVHLPAFVLTQGTSEFNASLLISIVGLSGLVGKFIIGAVAHNPQVSPVAVTATCFTTTGIATCLLPFYGSSYIGQVIFASIFGVSSAPLLVLLPALTLLYVDLPSLSTSMGIWMLWGGTGYLMGPPIAGMLFDIFSVYSSSFLFAGFCWILGAFVLLVPGIQHKLRTKIFPREGPIKETKLMKIEGHGYDG